MIGDLVWSQLAGRRTVILDLDGVVYRGTEAMPGAADAVARLRMAGYRIGYLTNNSGAEPVQLVEKLRAFGIPCEPSELMTSGLGAAILLSRECARCGNLGVHVLGTPQLRALVAAHGVRVTENYDVEIVLVGLDVAFDYETLALSVDTILRGARIWACNRDANFPAARGRILPGCGPIVAALEIASGRRAEVVVGKPERVLLDLLLAQLGEPVDSCLVIGDGLDSDVAMAQSCGVPAVWVTESVGDRGVVAVTSLAEFADRILGATSS